MLKYIHDNIITKYIVDFENNKIIIYTINENGEKINIMFEDILCYRFENQQKNSIILDIEKRKGKEFINDNIEILKKQKDFCWPISYDNIEELSNIIEEQQYNYYILYSSLGMKGWIMSKRLGISKKV